MTCSQFLPSKLSFSLSFEQRKKEILSLQIKWKMMPKRRDLGGGVILACLSSQIFFNLFAKLLGKTCATWMKCQHHRGCPE